MSAATTMGREGARKDRNRRSPRPVVRAVARSRGFEEPAADLAPGARLPLVDLGIPPPQA